MNELENARKEINAIDEEMARLFERRMKACGAIGAYKKEHGLPVRDPAREAAMLERCRQYIKDPGIEAYYIQFLKHNIELSCRYQAGIIGESLSGEIKCVTV